MANFNDCKLHTQPAPSVLAHLARRSRDPRAQGIALEALDLCREYWWFLLLLGLDPDLPAAPVTLPAATAHQHTGEVVWRKRRRPQRRLLCDAVRRPRGRPPAPRPRQLLPLPPTASTCWSTSATAATPTPPTRPPWTPAATTASWLTAAARSATTSTRATGRLLEHRHEPALSHRPGRPPPPATTASRSTTAAPSSPRPGLGGAGG